MRPSSRPQTSKGNRFKSGTPGAKGRRIEGRVTRALRFVSGNLVGTQAGILLFLVTAVSPLLGLAGFAGHAAFNLIVYFRYFLMARRRSR